MNNQNIKKGGIYIKELINTIIWVNKNQLDNKFENFALFNATLSPSPTLKDYAIEISKEFNYIGSYYSIPKFMVNVLLFISFCFTKIFKKSDAFNYYRLIKLFRSNNILPNYLKNKNYIFEYDLKKSFDDWKKIYPKDW